MANNYAVETISSLPFGMLIGAPLTAAIEAQSQAAKATIDFILQVGFLPPTVTNNQELADPDPVDITQPDALPAATANPTTNAGETRMVTFTYMTTNEDAALVSTAAAVAAAAAAAADAQGATQAMIAAATAAAGAQGATAASVAATIVPTTNQTATITVPLLSVVPIPFFSIDEMTIDFVAKITEAVTASSKATAKSVKSASTQARGMCSTHTSTSERSSKYQTELTMTIHVRASSESMPKGMAKVLDMLASLIKSERA